MRSCLQERVWRGHLGTSKLKGGPPGGAPLQRMLGGVIRGPAQSPIWRRGLRDTCRSELGSRCWPEGSERERAVATLLIQHHCGRSSPQAGLASGVLQAPLYS